MSRISTKNYGNMTQNVSYKFSNGLTLSMVIGNMSYCTMIKKELLEGFDMGAVSVELAVLNENKTMLKIRDDDDVAGWIGIDHIPEIMSIVSTASNGAECKKLVSNYLKLIK